MATQEPRQTRSEQREAARAMAKQIRESHQKNEARRRYTIFAGIAALILGVGALVGWAFISNSDSNLNGTATPTNAIFNNGVRVGTGLKTFTPTESPNTQNVPVVKIYLDYQCPICQAFDVPNSSLIKDKVDAGQWIVEYHPISFLDRNSLNAYSSRAANAAMCVAEYSKDDFLNFTNLLYANQPGEGTAGPDNAALIDFVKQVGAKNQDKISSCINNKSFGKWIADTTTEALSKKVPGTNLDITGTPTIVVNGQQYTWNTNSDLGSPARFEQWVTTAFAVKE